MDVAVLFAGISLRRRDVRHRQVIAADERIRVAGERGEDVIIGAPIATGALTRR